MRTAHPKTHHGDELTSTTDMTPTVGEVFSDGTIIEPVRSSSGSLKLLLRTGQTSIIGSRVCHNGRDYEPAAIDPTILRAMRLPTKSASYGSSRQLLTTLSTTLQRYCGLAENFATLAGHFVLASWLIGVIPIAPHLAISGTNPHEAHRLLQLLHCLCRHPLMLAQVDVHGIYSLPMGFRPTLLIGQRELSARMERLLSAVQKRDVYVPRRGRLLDLHCAIVTYTEHRGRRTSWPLSRIEIPARSAGQEAPALDDRTQQDIGDEFQPKLLGYRLENYGKACRSGFDAPEFVSPTRELAQCLGACTPDDPDLQAQLIKLLKAQDTEHRSELWTELDTVIIEALIGYVHEGEMDSIYTGKIAESAEVILECRGENRKVEPRQVGERLRDLGLNSDPRDSRGIKLAFSQAVRRRVHDLAYDLNVPTIHAGAQKCTYCKSCRPKEPASGNGKVATDRGRS